MNDSRRSAGLAVLCVTLAASTGLRAAISGDYTYSLSGNSATITAYGGAGGVIAIPSTLDGHSVTAIGGNSFSYSSDLVGVTIPDSVTSIGRSAFESCHALTTVTIGNHVTSISDNAFYECTSLTSLAVPASVTSIGDQVFLRCASLGTVAVEAANPSFSSVDGILFNKNRTTLILWPAARAGSYTVPGSVTSIGDHAFYESVGLTGVTIPDSVTSIGSYAFWWCTHLSSLTIGNHVTSIGYAAFNFCGALPRVAIPNSVTSIGSIAFASCSSLVSLTIGNHVTSIGFAAFDNCVNLTSVIIPRSVTSIGDKAFATCSRLTALYFQGNAPSLGGEYVFDEAGPVIVFYLSGTTGWGATYGGRTTSLWEGGSALTSQTIAFAALPPKAVGDADFAPGATASSGLAVTYTSSAPAVATIVNAKIHMVGRGASTITASQAGDADYSAAVPVSQVLTVSGIVPVITWTDRTISSGTVLSAAQLDASANTPGSFVYAPPAGTLLGVGAHPVTASFTPTAADRYDPAEKTVTITVTKAPQTVTFDTPPAQSVDGADFALSAVATSGLPVVFTSADPDVATVTAEGLVHLAGAVGAAVITASQAGNEDYAAAAVSRSLLVGLPFARGMVEGIQAADIRDGLVQVTRKPSIYGVYADPVRDPQGLKPKKAVLPVLTAISPAAPSAAFVAEWSTGVPLYDTKAFAAWYAQGKRCAEFAGQAQSAGVQLYAKTAEGGIATDATLANHVLVVRPPSIGSVTNWDGRAATGVHAGSEIVLRGRLFGKAAPKLWFEMTDPRTGAVKKVPCRVKTPLALANAAGRANQSAMDPFTGDSEVTVILPTAWPSAATGWVHGANDLVIENGVGLATVGVPTVAGDANSAPEAVADSAATPVNTPVLVGVLANDLDVESDAVSMVITQDPTWGKAAVVTGGVRYTPSKGWTGTDTFRYKLVERVTPGRLGSAADAEVRITVGGR